MAIIVFGKFQHMIIIMEMFNIHYYSYSYSYYYYYYGTVLYLTENCITRIEHKNGYKNIFMKPYTKEEQDIKNICSYVKNKINFFIKQCLTFRRLQYEHVLKF